MTRNVTMPHELPDSFSLPIDCFYCGFKFITTVEHINRVSGYLCPHCGKEVVLKNPDLQKGIEDISIMYDRTVEAFMQDEIRKRHGG